MQTAGPVPGGGSASRPPRRGRGRGPRRARASFVDESLFGSPAGARPAPPGFAPPWAAGPVPGDSGRRPRSKCRLGSHTPSFCDESLFGAKPRGPAWAAPWMRKEDVAKLHALLWSPPPAPRTQPGLSPRPRETPLRALRPPAPVSPASAAFEGGRKGQPCPWQRPECGSCPEGRGAPSRGRSQSLSRLNTPSGGLRLASETTRTERCEHQSPLTAPVTPRGPLMRGRSKSVSGPPLSRSSTAVGGCKPRPPWK
ncbi:RBPJ-interacting and tubulin-associated protein 1 [Larus michahellis]|uniref:RBPJ-interacting and tubulin-associated protein 1 n=1 Tax=Larus michahellis TaxID=119627 RepID=UPI003D9BEAE1